MMTKDTGALSAPVKVSAKLHNSAKQVSDAFFMLIRAKDFLIDELIMY